MLLITGGNGQLASALKPFLKDALFADRKALDITDEKMLGYYIVPNRIDTIINCAAYTSVDGAEEDGQRAFDVNVVGARNVARSGCRVIHISTDYVFDGSKNTPYLTTDVANPLSVYGKTKLLGEKEIEENADVYAIIRTSWLYSAKGRNFFTTMRNLGQSKAEVNVVCDQIGTPTYAVDLASAIVQVTKYLDKRNTGIYHFSNEGVCSWYDFAFQIMEMNGYSCAVNPIYSVDYPTKATRPAYSVLDKTKIKDVFNVKTRHWQRGVEECTRSS